MWQPRSWPVAADWQPVVDRFLASVDAQKLEQFVDQRLHAGAVVFPPRPFWALELTPLSRVQVVILGQDPYHGPGQAQGLAFSVAQGNKLPPSLRNIFKEISRETGRGVVPVANGSLVRWARQGVLLLNTCLTVEQADPGSHAKKGWEALTDDIIRTVASKPDPVVFMLWGVHAQAKLDLLRKVPRAWGEEGGADRHLVLVANHPSPLSALRPPQPFIGCGHFGLANAFFLARGRVPIQW